MSWYGDLYTIDEFCNLIEKGCINSLDGYGYYSIDGDNEIELVSFNISDIRKRSIKKGYRYVWWYNK